MDTKKLWENALAEIELTVSKANFNMWFKDTRIVRFEDGIIFLSVPNVFVKDWLYNKFHKFVLKCLRAGADVRGIEYVVSKDDQKRQENETERRIPVNSTSEMPLNDYYINKEDNLNPRYTFESFVVGPFNELAHAASQAVIKKPGITYNPLFIYGDTGRGKTHLIQAVGNYLKGNTAKKVFYVTSEKFGQDYINSLQNNKVNVFKEKYRRYDVLVMDDIQFFSTKEKMQEELFHLFNNLYDDNKQIIFSSDKHPNYIPHLEERLKSRFAAGMIVDIPHPDQESRAAILRAKSKMQNFELSTDNIEYLASTIDGNIRELEGALNSVIMHSQLKGRELNVNEIKNLIKDNSKPKKAVSVKDVIKTIADFYNIEEASIYEKTRRKEVVRPRQLIMYVLREEFDVSYPSIGQKLGGRDHTTVIHSCEKIKNELKTNHILAQELKQIRSMF
ncbi:chromosomal replication initiator protein DnaA [Candidatus Parcubacteria bacterium]|nr:chromosomal replication initiator protein DnaA [Candidatus Parcubacteria bacterium]